MKILIVNTHIAKNLGGSEMQCDLIAKGLSELGHHVVYGAVASAHPLIINRDEYAYEIIHVQLGQSSVFYDLLMRLRPDVVYWRYNKHHLKISVDESIAAGIPFVFAISHINDIKKFGIKRAFFDFRKNNPILYLKHVLKQYQTSALNFKAFEKITAVTSLNEDYLNKVPVKLQKKIWNSVPETLLPFDWEKPYCAWVANIKPQKRPEVFIEIARLFSKKKIDLDFIMVGQIQSQPYTEILERASDISNFHYLGKKSPEEVNGILQRALCLVHSCKPEGFGNIFIQAWKQGCPTITLEFDPESLIQKHSLGFVSGSKKQLFDDIWTIYSDHSLRNKLSENALNFGRNNFSAKRMVKEVETFLMQIVNAD